MEDLYQKRHTWQTRPAIQPENVWTGAKFSLPQGEDAQSVYSKDNNGIPKGNTLTRNPGQIQTANFVQVKSSYHMVHIIPYYYMVLLYGPYRNYKPKQTYVIA